MRRKRLLFNTEFTQLSTGYAIYGHELLKALHKMDQYEIFELASYARGNDPHHQKLMGEVPWRVIPNMPIGEAEQREYDNDPVNEFGKWKFDKACLDVQPDVVCSFTDIWMHRFIDDSPFRRLFKTVMMATVDAQPQSAEWLDFYQRTDYTLNYTEYGDKVFKDEGGGLINLRGVASPAIDREAFKPVQNKKQHKANNGIDPNSIIIGMVARNQKRKLYPQFAESFVEFLYKTDLANTENVFLYWHSAHPDMGFRLDWWTNQTGLSHKVLFTFYCKNCQLAFPSFYQDVRVICPRCKQAAASFANSQVGVSRETLAGIYNLFDLYVQYSISEGFGIPITEAAMCGIPICATNYSGMESILENIGGFPIPVKTFYTEAETNRQMAIPDGSALADYIKDFVSQPESMRARLGYQTHLKAAKRYGSWDEVAQKWASIFDEIPIPEQNVWATAPIDYLDMNSLPPCPNHQQMNDYQFVNWLLMEVLRRPDFVNSYIHLKMVRDLIYGGTAKGQLGFFSSELSSLGSRPQWQEFNREILYNYVKGFRNKTNQYELERHKRIKEGIIK